VENAQRAARPVRTAQPDDGRAAAKKDPLTRGRK
jgi:hypothetical protein